MGKADDLKSRLRGHLHCKYPGAKKDWIDSLVAMGLKPIISEIDVLEDGKWEFWEAYYISLFKSWGFNLLNASMKKSKETRDKISRSNKQSFSNPELRLDISRRESGKVLSEATKKKLSKINSGSGNPFFGKMLTKEHRQNISKGWAKRREGKCQSA